MLFLIRSTYKKCHFQEKNDISRGEPEMKGIKIAVEIKSFTGIGLVSEFHKAMGQYDHYAYSLKKNEPDRKLYLAIPLAAWEGFFQRPFVQEILSEKSVNFIIFEPETQEIKIWNA